MKVKKEKTRIRVRYGINEDGGFVDIWIEANDRLNEIYNVLKKILKDIKDNNHNGEFDPMYY